MKKYIRAHDVLFDALGNDGVAIVSETVWGPTRFQKCAMHELRKQNRLPAGDIVKVDLKREFELAEAGADIALPPATIARLKRFKRRNPTRHAAWVAKDLRGWRAFRRDYKATVLGATS